MEILDLLADTIEITNRRKEVLNFVRFIQPQWLVCWQKNKDRNALDCMGTRVHDIMIESLKAIKVWEQLPSEIQRDVQYEEDNYKDNVCLRIEKAQVTKRRKYEGMGIPHEIICYKCSEPYKVVPRVFLKDYEKVKAEKTMEEYISTWACSVCNPKRRGREANPLFASIPKELKCACGKVVASNPSTLAKRVEKLGVSIENYVRNFQCQKCRPSKGFKKGHVGKVKIANPLFDNLPTEMTCKCGNKVKANLYYLKAKAEKNNTTIEELLKNFVCQSCSPSHRGRPRKIKV